MIKKAIYYIFLVVGFAFSVSAQQEAAPAKKEEAPPKLPQASDIVDKYVKAIGGKAAYEKLKTRKDSGTLLMPSMGISGTYEAMSAAPDKLYMKMSITGIGDMTEGSDGKTVWSVNPLTGNREKSGIELKQALITNNFYKDIKIKELYAGLETIRKDKVGERDAYVVKATNEGLPDDIMYFDAETGYLMRTDMTAISPEGRQTVSTYYSDFREVSGIKLPFKYRMVTPQFEMSVSMEKVEFGVEIDDSKFSKPSN